MRRHLLALLSLLLSLSVSGCGGGGHKSTPTPTPTPTVSISVAPLTPSVQVGAIQQFTATVTGSTNTAVTWSTPGPGTVSASGLYTAPVSTTTPASVTVTATAQADSTKSASTTVSIPAVSASIAPGTANIILGATQQFTATVQNATDTSVKWSASPSGTIGSSGLYTVLGALQTPANVTITAAPNADPAKTATSTVTIPAVSVALSPAKITLTNGSGQRFAATVSNATDTTVTWSMTGKGSLDNTGQYAAPTTISSGDTATVTATSKADATKSVSASITLEIFSRTIAGYVIMPDVDFKSLTVDMMDTATGKLRPAGVHFVAPDMYTNPAMVATHPSKSYLYTVAGFVGILGYALNANGSMTPLQGSPFSAPNIRPMTIGITPNGKFLYVVNEYGSMWGWTIDQASGALTSIAGSPWTTGIDGPAMAIDSGSSHLYAMAAGNYQDSSIGVFDIDSATGALTSVQTITAPGAGGASGMAITPSGKFLYATGFYNGVVDGFKIDATTGELTFIAGSPFNGGGYPGEGLAVDPLGKYVYAGNRTGIAMYTIDPGTGVLTEVTGSPFLTEFGESSDFHPDPTGSVLYTNDGFTMTAVSVDRVNNKLAFLNSIHSRTTVGTGRWDRFGIANGPARNSLSSRFAYVLNNQDRTISAYSVDDTTGALSSIGTAIAIGGVNPLAMAIDWYGNFLYVVNQGSNTISAFTINPATGALTSVPGSPFATGSGPTGVAVEATGRVPFVGTAGDDSLSQYTIDPTTGALTLAGSTPTGQCTGTRTLVADWRGDYLYQVCPGSNKTAVYALQIASGLLDSTSPHSTCSYGGTSLVLSPYSAAPPHDPNWQSFGFLVSQQDQQIKQFTIGNEGELSMVSTGPVGPTQGIALDPWGRFAYATNASANNVQAVSIDPSEGTLTEVNGSPYSTGVFPIAAALDTTGRFLYLVNRDSNTISGYVLNRETGQLTPMAGQTFATGGKPLAILITGTVQ